MVEGGGTAIIVKNTPYVQQAKTFNVTIEDLHTYYVLAGTTPILVHNSSPCGPTVANGAALESLSVSEITRIQNAANSRGVTISVVGSRVKGPRSPGNPNGFHAESDWDYVITGIDSRTKSRISSSLPSGDVTLGRGRRQDILTGPLVETEPHITFHPQG